MNSIETDRGRRRWLLLGIVAAGVAVDQFSKILAEGAWANQPPQDLLFGCFTLTYTLNPGAFLSLGGGLPDGLRQALLIGFVAVFALGASAYLIWAREVRKTSVWGLSLLASGAIGNLIDRLVFDAVRDFMIVRVGPVSTGVFNIADMVLLAGAAFLVVEIFQREKKSA